MGWKDRMGCVFRMKEEYRTSKDIVKDIIRSYQSLGKYLSELDRMIHKPVKKEKTKIMKKKREDVKILNNMFDEIDDALGLR